MLGFAGKIAIVPDVDADQHHSSEDDEVPNQTPLLSQKI